MDIQFISAIESQYKADAFFTTSQGQHLSPWANDADKQLNHMISHAMQAAEFKGKFASEISLFGGESYGQIFVLGADKENISEKNILGLGGKIAQLAFEKKHIVIDFAPIEKDVKIKENSAALLAQAIMIGSWRFLKYKTEDKKECRLEKVEIYTSDARAAQKRFAKLSAIAEGMAAARELVAEPGNVLYPQTFMEKAKALEALGCEVTVLDKQALQEKKMGAILSVGQGSEKPPFMVAIHWKGAKDKSQAPIAFVGKGVTFDTGGISLKPGQGMEDMIFDMGGAAAVFGALKAAALRKAPVNIVGILGLVENMPSGSASRPGDIVTSYSGKTIEIINTDAEGRLVLSDCLTYAQKDCNAKTVINLATLTGAMLVALGMERAGLFCNDENLSTALMNAGDESNELLWPFPLGEEYDDMIKARHGDIQNMGNKGRYGGSIAAAKFLQAFIEKDVHWAHLDIAPTAWHYEDKLPVVKGASGYGVRLLHQWLENTQEKES